MERVGGEFSEQEIEGFVLKLESFFHSLEVAEKQLMMAALCSTLDPFERMKYREAASLLSDEELAFLNAMRNFSMPK